MPRNKIFRKDLSKGWKDLNRLWKISYEEKLQYSRQFIKNIIKDHQNPVICWSGGKDSTVVLHLVRSILPDIPVINVQIDVEFSETNEFIDKVSNDWGVNLFKNTSKEYTFWQIGNKYGWPIFGKGISSNVGRAIRTGNIRPQLSEFEKLLVKNKAHISNKCAYYLREKPGKELEESLKADLKFIGLRAEESRMRSVLWVDYGDYYYVKRYYRRNYGIWKANPISTWTSNDVWRYHFENKLPYCDIYDNGYERNGCWTCAMAIKHGQLKRLRKNYPEKYNELLESLMGNELIRLLLIIKKMTPNYKMYDSKSKTEILTKYPNFLDGY